MAKSLSPFLMFTGKAEEAINFYVELFPNSSIDKLTRYGPDDAGTAGTIQHATINLNGQKLFFIDSPAVHEFDFTPSISMFVEAENAQEVDRLHEALSNDGLTFMPLNSYDFATRYSWVQDKFGVSWQLGFEVST
ncbi:VOC family protein [Maritalea sp.]|uniref:VOC family protein n=1 Tax=Maritalea sp. TaxID=2003361 RepID=UPI003EFA181A